MSAFRELNWPVVFIWAALSAIGLIAIYSATLGPVSDFLPSYIQNNFFNQLAWIALSLVVLCAVQFTNPRTFQQIAYGLYLICILLAIATVLWGTEAGGARRWLVIGSVHIQISEMLKLATILAVANYLTHRRNVSAENLGTALTATALLLIPAGIIILQNDTGTALILLAIIPIMLFWSGLPHAMSLLIISPAIIAYFSVIEWYLGVMAAAVLTIIIFFIQNRVWPSFASLILGALVVIGTEVALQQVLQPYQKARVQAFVNPTVDPQGAGWNVLQAKTAIGSGGMYGKGFMEGTQTQLRFLPEQWTDFIFCVIGEEFGFIGAGIVLSLFLALVILLINMAGGHPHPFAQLVIVSIAAVIFFHFLLNIGSAMALIPVIGLPLPFVSYGGSAYITYTIMLAICLNMDLYKRSFSIYR